ncbi:MAG: BON domain-containing protein [Vicinamibacterales bacterium]
MLGALLRAVVLIVVLVAGAAFLLGWWGRGAGPTDDRGGAVGTTGVDTGRAREVGAEVGERTAVAADQARRALTDGSLTTKIKAKMALDDSVKALDIDVDTNAGVVTVSGIVGSPAQRDRALQLARETEGVRQVVDKLKVK